MQRHKFSKIKLRNSQNSSSSKFTKFLFLKNFENSNFEKNK